MALPIVTGSSELALTPDAHVGAFLATVRGFFDQAHEDALGVVDESLSEQRVIVEALGKQNRVLQVQVAQLEAARKEAETAHTAVEDALKAENEALHQQLEQMRAERDRLNEKVQALEPHQAITKEIKRLTGGLRPGCQRSTKGCWEHNFRMNYAAHRYGNWSWHDMGQMVYNLMDDNKALWQP